MLFPSLKFPISFDETKKIRIFKKCCCGSSINVTQVSTLCKQLMHQFVAEELRRVCTTPASECRLGGNLSLALETGSEQPVGEEATWHALVRTALERSFQRMNRLRQHTCTCGNITECNCGIMILTRPVAAVVAILTAQQIVIANSGTSRAVLGRAGRSLPLAHNYQVI